MSAVTASLCSTLMFVLFVSAEQKTITAESGQDVTLTCRDPTKKIIVVKWRRADLGDQYVLLYQDGHFDPQNQHPSFKNRVDLQDRQMKDGDVSLILKDVTINDTGTYECHVFIGETRSWELSIIHLHVVRPGQTGGQEKDGGKKDGGVRLIVGVTLTAVLLVAVVGCFLIYRRCKPNPHDPHEYQKTITVKSGQDVTLTCQDPTKKITAVKWSREDLGNEYVFWSKGAWVVAEYQHSSFKNRVDLQDRQMMNGNVSLILKDVTIDDAGTYECNVFMNETRSWMNISSIYLHVDPPGRKTITAESGQDVTLTCRAPNSESEKMSFMSLIVDPES